MKTYGTTLLGAFTVSSLLVFFRLGDGEALLVASDGTARKVFVDHGEKAHSNQTASLSMSDAANWFELEMVELEREPVSWALLCSDGVSDPYTIADSEAAAEDRESELAKIWGRGAMERVAKLG